MVSPHSTAPEGDTPSDANSSATGAPRAANRLANETSPYLLQHAHNPVDWYPWGDEALARARAEDKPILLSIGYSACHWCHVMERESFENPRIAALMNALVRQHQGRSRGAARPRRHLHAGRPGDDRQRRLADDRLPDARRHAVLRRHLFPARRSRQMPGFPRVLAAIADAWRTRRDEVARERHAAARALCSRRCMPPARRATSTPTHPRRGRGRVWPAQYDAAHGGFGGAPKFPQPMALEFLLRYWQRTGDAAGAAVAAHTLDQMARGGIYDHLGGGFPRYCTDNEWLVPHFEKMLYDNAQLARAYLMALPGHGQRVLPDDRRGDLDYVLREMTDPSGGFYSTQDADSEGEEGKFYVWTPAEVEALLGAEDGRLFGAFYDVTERGNFEDAQHPAHATHAAGGRPTTGRDRGGTVGGARARPAGAVRGARADASDRRATRRCLRPGTA